MDTNIKFNTIDEAIEAIKAGKMVVVVDDEHRENEGDLVMAAEHATQESINFMARYGRGLICMPLEKNQANKLGIGPMIKDNTDQYQTAFTESIDHMETTTGISAYERSLTILKAIEADAKPGDFKKPGHIFPLIGKDGGVLKRAGHTEASIDLARLAGCKPAGVICEIMNEDGTMARVDDLVTYCKEHDLMLVTIADLIEYRSKQDHYVKRAAESILPTDHGEFLMVGFENTLNGEHHVALVKGKITPDEPTLIRVHSECLTGDAFASQRCDCGDQLHAAMEKIEKEGKGILLYMRQEGRGIGLINKIKAYELQDQGMDTVEANLALGLPEDARDYGIGAQILKDLHVGKIRLMTNNPQKIHGLGGYGLEVVERVNIQTNHHERSDHYMRTKKDRMGHLLKFEEEKK